MMTLVNVYLNITQDDINAGLVDNCFKCPGALAAIRVFGSNFRELETVHLVLSNYIKYRISHRLVLFITKFDTLGAAKPEVFELQVPLSEVMLPIVNNIVKDQ